AVPRGKVMVSVATAISALKIVVVSSDVELRRFLKETLESQCDHEVVGEASTGTDMVRTVLRLEPDLVIFDLQLPRLSGLVALRQIGRERGVAAVAIATERDQELVRGILEDEVQAYLVKPVLAHQVEPAVDVAWARFEEQRQFTSENASLRQKLQNR